MSSVGPLLAFALVLNIGGNASRSELDFIAEPVKKLARKHKMSKSWLESALHSPYFPSDKVRPDEKQRFLSQIIRYV